jgi:hypothetical protein
LLKITKFERKMGLIVDYEPILLRSGDIGFRVAIMVKGKKYYLEQVEKLDRQALIELVLALINKVC